MDASSGRNAAPERALRRQLLRGAAGAFAGTALAFSGRAYAQVPGWPVRPVRVVVPVTAGGQTDLFARFICDHLARVFGQPFVVENKPGGSGTIGALQVVKAPADGHALLFSAASFSVVPQALNPQLPYDNNRDLVAVVQVGAGGQFLAVANDFPARSVKELIEVARAQPDRLSYGTTGVGSVTHIFMSALLSQQRVRMSHVPYKSGAEVLRDLSAGVLQVGWMDTTNGGPAGKSGRIRLLGISGTWRVPGNPDVATLAEQGYGLEQNGWLGMFAPAGTPAPVVRAINAEVNRLMAGDEARSRLAAMNAAVFPANTPEQFAQTVAADIAAWRKIVVDNDIRAD